MLQRSIKEHSFRDSLDVVKPSTSQQHQSFIEIRCTSNVVVSYIPHNIPMAEPIDMVKQEEHIPGTIIKSNAESQFMAFCDDDANYQAGQPESQGHDGQRPEQGGCPEPFDDDQEVRKRDYFFGKEPEDYTEGPVRLFSAQDGNKSCIGMLLTFDFSACVQRAIHAQRDFAKAERVATRELEVAMNFETRLRAEIRHHEARVTYLDPSNIPDNYGEPDPDGEALWRELRLLRGMLQQSKDQRQRKAAWKEKRVTLLRDIQAEVNAYLEDAFVNFSLVEEASDEPDTPIKDRDLRAEFERYQNEHPEPQRYLRDVNMSPDIIRPNSEEPPLTEEEDPEQFDLSWIERYQELARELIEAESAFEHGKAALVEAGLFEDGSGECDSYFIDDVGDGYQTSMDPDEYGMRPELDQWLCSIPADADPNFLDGKDVDVLETQSIGFGESVSVVAEGPESKRIDEWSTFCGN